MANFTTLHKKLEEIANQFPEKIASQMKRENGYQIYTYKKFYDTSQAIAHFLITSNIKKGDKIAIVLENRPEWGMVYFGILFAGGIAVPIDPQSNQQEINFILSDSQSKIVFTSSKHLSLFKETTSPQKIADIDSPDFSKIISASPLSEVSLGFAERRALRTKSLPEVFPQDLVSILYTSGTTGKPKGVMLTHKNFLANFQSIDKLKLFSDKDNVLSILPLHHSYPFMITLIIPLFCQSRITYIPTLKSDELLTCMRESGITIMVGVPQLFYMFYKNITTKIKEVPFLIRTLALKFIFAKIRRAFGKKLRFFACGGAKLDPETARFLTKIGFTILEGYGLTETSPVVTFNPLNPCRQKIGSVGKIIPDVRLKIAQPNKKGIGEVLIKGDNVMQGYYKQDEETKNVLKDGWFYSGDLGYLDKQGYLYLSGRKKEIIVLSSGKNISPEEVEAHYIQSPFIKEICVLAIGKTGEERLSAVIVPDLDYCRKVGGVNINDKIKWDLENLSSQLSSYKRIMGWTLTNEELPRTRLGKIKRFAVKEKYLTHFHLRGVSKVKQSESDADLKILSSNIGKKIIEGLNKITKRDVGLNEHLELDLGIDSLGRVELMAGLDKVLKIDLPDSSMAGAFTVRELIFQIEKLLLEKGAENEKILPIQNEADLWKEILQRHPSKQTIQKIDLSPNWIARLFTLLIAKILYLIFKIFWRLKITGRENIPKGSRFILCSNHGSFLDGPLIFASISAEIRKNMLVLGLRAYFELPLIRNMVRFLRVIPIDSTVQLVDAMQSCAYIIRNGKMPCIFPEGARSPDGGVKKFKKGIGILAKELNLRLIPVYISGSYESWPRTKHFPKLHPIKIIFGKPFGFEELKKEGLELGAKNDYEAISLGIREEIIRIAKKNKPYST